MGQLINYKYMAKKKAEITETQPSTGEVHFGKIDPVTADFGRTDLNELRDKFNLLLQVCQK